MLRLTSYILASTFLIIACGNVLAGQQKTDEPQKHDSKEDASEIYVVGGDVKPPKIIHYVEPEFSPSSQEAYIEGVVRVAAVVNLDGTAADLEVIKGLSSEEDKLAVQALKQWRFKPGTKKDQPVRVRIKVEINFHLL